MLLYLQAEWVALNYVPFAERSMEVMVDLYHKTACHKAVINEKVLQNIIKVSDTAHLTWWVYCSSILLNLLATSIYTWQYFQLPICLSSDSLLRYLNSLSRFWLVLHLQVASDPKAVVTVKLKRTVFVLCKNVPVIVQTNLPYTLNVTSKERTDKLNIGSI